MNKGKKDGMIQGLRDKNPKKPKKINALSQMTLPSRQRRRTVDIATLEEDGVDIATLEEDGVDTATLKEVAVDIATEEITDVDRATRKRRYSDGNFIPGTISHQKL